MHPVAAYDADGGRPRGGDNAEGMAERSESERGSAPDQRPNSWGFGDGQAIPWDYAPAPRARDIVTLKERYGLFINRQSVPAAGSDTFVSIDPSTEQPLAEVARASAVDVDKAVRAAAPSAGRGASCRAGARQVPLPHLADPPGALASSLSSNRWTRASRSRAATSTCRWPPTISGTTRAGRTSSTMRSRPRGEAARCGRADHPVGFPLLMLAWKIAPALAAGNAVILKPASTTPLSAMLFADVCNLQADLPPGTVSIITGPGEIGMHLATHPDIDKVAFTGSTEIGKKIGRGVAGSDKGLTLELGGKAANISCSTTPRSTRQLKVS